MNFEDLQGIIPPMVTPFTENEELDIEGVRKEVKYLLDCNINGIAAGGSTGEGVLLSNQELEKILDIIQEENERGIPVIAGVIKNSTRKAIETGLIAKKAGADVLLVTPVFYHGASDQGNYEYYKKIAEEVDMPVIIYNVVPTNQISPELMLKISEIENVIGIKQIDAELVAAMVATCGHKIKVFSACDDMLYSTYVSGACGAIAAILTAVPELCIDQWQSFKNGDQERAMAIHKRLYHVFQAYNAKPFPGRIKELINQLGRPVGRARGPIVEPDQEEKGKIHEGLKKAGLK